ncbi:response regulator [Christiangramia aquimixticola]|uniref:response regulator n=1 Tax=Christiangramia aquimixticola TaxID=1697558 RepID=UPI003AA84C1D
MINKKLNILLVEDNQSDIYLIKRQISKIVKEPVIKTTDNLLDCKELLVSFAPDVVLSDYNLPTCTGLDILNLVKEFDETIAFIFITGTIHDEELAAHTILNGASGYILKKHMNYLYEKLEPLLKKVVFNLISKDELREKIRDNKITVNKIHSFLEKMNADDKEQRQNIEKIREAISRFNVSEDNA